MFSSFSSFELTLAGDVAIFVVTLLASTKIKDVLSGVPTEARAAADTLLADTKAKLSAAKADVLADVKAKFSVARVATPVVPAPVTLAPAPASVAVIQPAAPAPAPAPHA